MSSDGNLLSQSLLHQVSKAETAVTKGGSIVYGAARSQSLLHQVSKAEEEKKV